MTNRYRLLQEMFLYREGETTMVVPIGTEVSKRIMETTYKGSCCREWVIAQNLRSGDYVEIYYDDFNSLDDDEKGFHTGPVQTDAKLTIRILLLVPADVLVQLITDPLLKSRAVLMGLAKARLDGTI